MSSPTVTQKAPHASVPEPVWDRGKLFLEPDWPPDDVLEDDDNGPE